MKIFGNYTYTWWQVGIFKISLLSLGALLGAYFHEYFINHLFIFLVVGLVSGGYIAFVSFNE